MILVRDRAGYCTDNTSFPKSQSLFTTQVENSFCTPGLKRERSGEQLDPSAHARARGGTASTATPAPGTGCARQRHAEQTPTLTQLTQLWGRRHRCQPSPAPPSPQGPVALTNLGRSLPHRGTCTTRAAHTHRSGTLQRPDMALDIGSCQEAGTAVPGDR